MITPEFNLDNQCPVSWPKAIIRIDMNAFFAAIEQLDFPELREKPVAITNGLKGSSIITYSYEARAYGIKTGMHIRDAKQICPKLIQRASRHERYGKLSKKIMDSLIEITPDIEIFSVDEAFLDVTYCQQLHGTPLRMGKMLQTIIQEKFQLPCSIGISGDKTTAKFAANLKKPNGLTLIPPWEAKKRLADVRITELCGIGKGIDRFLASFGVVYCGDMEKLPISILSKRFGSLGKKLWHMCLGLDPSPVCSNIVAPKSMGHGKVMPPYTNDPKMVWTYLQYLCEKLATRLRRHHLVAQEIFYGVKCYDLGWIGDKVRLPIPTDDGRIFFDNGKRLLESLWHHQAIWHIQVTALDPNQGYRQMDLFTKPDLKTNEKNKAVDEINQRFGKYTLTTASLFKSPLLEDATRPFTKESRL